MKEENLSVLNKENEKLIGLKTIPEESKEKYPTLILVHGFGVDKHEKGMFDELSELLSNNNFLVFRFSFSGSGKSEGKHEEMSITKRSEELNLILDFVKNQPDVDTNNIGILAQSFGTPITVASLPEVKTIILIGSISTPKEHFVKSFEKRGGEYNPKGISTRPTSFGTMINIGPQFWTEFDNYDLLENIKKLNCPILFINGSDDPFVDFSQSKTYFEDANEPKEMFMHKGGDHDLKPNRELAFEKILSWCNKYLK